MENISVKNFFNVLVLKNQLITLDSYELKDLYENYNDYITFLATFCVLTSIDSGFLFLDDSIIDKIEEIINIHRFDTDSETYEIINESIQYLNSVKGFNPSQKILYRDSYLAYQEDIRNVKINSIDELLNYLAYDAYMVVAIEDVRIEFIDDNKMFMASLNYLMEMAPEVLQNPCIYNLMNDCLNSIEVNPFSFKTKRLLKETKNNYKKIKK